MKDKGGAGIVGKVGEITKEEAADNGAKTNGVRVGVFSQSDWAEGEMELRPRQGTAAPASPRMGIRRCAKPLGDRASVHEQKALSIDKGLLITWLATLPNDSVELMRVEAIRRGVDLCEREEGWLNLKEVSQNPQVQKHVVWLSRLGVPQECGEWLAGRRRYRLSRVVEYLKSDRCRARIAALNEQRRAKAAADNGRSR